MLTFFWVIFLFILILLYKNHIITGIWIEEGLAIVKDEKQKYNMGRPTIVKMLEDSIVIKFIIFAGIIMLLINYKYNLTHVNIFFQFLVYGIGALSFSAFILSNLVSCYYFIIYQVDRADQLATFEQISHNMWVAMFGIDSLEKAKALTYLSKQAFRFYSTLPFGFKVVAVGGALAGATTVYYIDPLIQGRLSLELVSPIMDVIDERVFPSNAASAYVKFSPECEAKYDQHYKQIKKLQERYFEGLMSTEDYHIQRQKSEEKFKQVVKYVESLRDHETTITKTLHSAAITALEEKSARNLDGEGYGFLIEDDQSYVDMVQKYRDKWAENFDDQNSK